MAVVAAASVASYVFLVPPGIGGEGLLVIVERFEVDLLGSTQSLLILANGEKVCTSPDIREGCPPLHTVSFRLTVEISKSITADDDWEAPVRAISSGTLRIGIPDDTGAVAISLEAAALGLSFVPNATRNILNSPFETTAWTITQFEVALPDGTQAFTGELTYSVEAIGRPFDVDYSQGSFDTGEWPPALDLSGAVTISVSQSPDAMNWLEVSGAWVLTFEAVPEIMANSVTLTLFDANGTTRTLSSTNLPDLMGDGLVKYVPIDATPSFQSCNPSCFINVGDKILLTTVWFKVGARYELRGAGSLLAEGILS